MVYEWFTLEQAAKHLGVSTRTLRRWIRAGKLQAELRPGPYGHQYLVPLKGLDAVQVVRDVERAERQAEREAVPRVVEEYLARREEPLVRVVEALAGELREAMQRLEKRQEALLAELAGLRRELAELRGGSGAAGPVVEGEPRVGTGPTPTETVGGQ